MAEVKGGNVKFDRGGPVVLVEAMTDVAVALPANAVEVWAFDPWIRWLGAATAASRIGGGDKISAS